MVRNCLGILALMTGTVCSLPPANAAATTDLTGRLHVDYAYYDEDERPLGDGFLVRRARVGVEGKLDAPWAYELEVDFAENDLSAKDAWFRYTGWDFGSVTLGQFKVPFGFNELESSSDITFIEKALPSNAFAPSRRLGIGFQTESGPWLFQSMAFGQEIGADVRQESGDEGLGAGARLVFGPVVYGQQVHLGIAGTLEEPASSAVEEARFRTYPEARPADVYLVNTGDIPEVSHLGRLGLEAAWRAGPWSVQAEWMDVAVHQEGQRADPEFRGYYLSTSWFMTGESRAYSEGRFQGIEPLAPAGAWELGMRYSSIDLSNGPVQGGEAHNLTLGLNWYPNPRVRFMFNLILTDSEQQGRGDDPLIALFRGQIGF